MKLTFHMRKFLVFFSMLMLGAASAFAQTHTVNGSVRDPAGAPVPYATVTESGTKNATTADGNGNFSIKMRGNGGLTITATGFEANSITPSGNRADVELKSNTTELATVTVTTALGQLRSKNTLPYAAQQVLGDEVNKTRNNNFIDGLSGRIAGLQITQNNSMGSSTNVIIR